MAAAAAGAMLLPAGQGVAAAATTGVSYSSHEKPPLCAKRHCGPRWWGWHYDDHDFGHRHHHGDHRGRQPVTRPVTPPVTPPRPPQPPPPSKPDKPDHKHPDKPDFDFFDPRWWLD